MPTAFSRFAAALFLILFILALPLLIFSTHTLTQSSSRVSMISAPPSQVTVGDGEAIHLVFNLSASGVTQTNPTIAFILTVEGLNASILDYSTVSCYALISGPGSVVNITSVGIDVNSTAGTVQAYLYYTQALPFTDFNMSIVFSIKPLYGVYNVSLDLHYLLTVSTADNPYALQYENTTRVSIVPKPPTVTLVSIEPYPPIFAPGTQLNMTLDIYDASRVDKVNISIVDSSGRSVWSNSYAPNTTEYRIVLSISTAGWSPGIYRVLVYANDTLGIANETTVTELNLTWVFYVPAQFPNLSSAISHSGTLPGSTIVVTRNITESSTVLVDKPNLTIVGIDPSVFLVISSGIGIEITAPSNTIANISIQSQDTVIRIDNSTSETIENVRGYGARFLEVVASPSQVDKWNHTVANCTLNNKPVLYLLGGYRIERQDLAEVHTLFGSYTIETSSIGNLYAVNASIQLYNTSVMNTSLLNSELRQLWSLRVYVTFAGKPVNNATVIVYNNLSRYELHTDSSGSAQTFVLYMVANDTSTLRANTSVIEVYKYMFRNSTSIMIDRPITISLALPTPRISIETLNIRGIETESFGRGELALINVSISELNASTPIPIEIRLEVSSSAGTKEIAIHTLGQMSSTATVGIRMESDTEVSIAIKILDLPSIELKPVCLRCSE